MLYLFSSAFVCLFVTQTKTTRLIFTKYCGQFACGPRLKPLDFGGNSDDVMLGSGLKLGQGYGYG